MIVFAIIVLTTLIPMAALYTGIIVVKDPAKFKKVFFLFIYVVAMVAFCYAPSPSNDLARYYAQIEQCKRISFSHAFSWGADGLAVKNLLFWIISRTNQEHLLQAISTATLYGVAAYVGYDSIGNNKSAYYKLFLLTLALLPIYLIVNNVRNVLAFALVILAVYRDLVCKKRNVWTVLLYIIPCFIHISGFTLVLVRLFIPLFKNHFRLGIILTIIIPFLAVELYPITKNIAIPGSVGLIVKRAIWKAYSTVVGTSEYAISTHESGYTNLCRIVIFIVCFTLSIITIRYLKSKNGKEDPRQGFMVFDLIICSFTCVYILCGAVKFWVFGVASVIAAAPVLSIFFDGKHNMKKLDISFLNVVSIMAGARALLELYYIYTRMNLSEYFYNLFTTNIYTIAFRIVKYIVAGS